MHDVAAPALRGKSGAAAIVVGLLLAGPAWAGRPLQTEDAGVLDRGACEVEGAFTRLSAGADHARERSLQFGCGVGLSTQLALAAARSRDGADAERVLRLGGKTGVWQGAADDAPEVTLAYSWTTSKDTGGDWHHSASELRLVLSKPITEGTVHANLGHERDATLGVRSMTWGLAYEHAAIGPVAPMAELFGDDRAAPWWSLGVRFTAVPDTLFLDASYGRQIVGGRPTLLSLGFKFAF